MTDARQFTVIEAKMASGLSPGTRRAPAFNQAARNVACIAHLLSDAQIDPSTMARLAFVLVAPAARISEGIFNSVMGKDALRAAVAHRAHGYDTAAVEWCRDHFERVLVCCSVEQVSWESLLEQIADVDEAAAKELTNFYRECLRYNSLVKREDGRDPRATPVRQLHRSIHRLGED